MTDEQIIKSLNDTVGKEHIGIYCTDKNGNYTTVIKLTDIVDFINRQKSTIDELTKAYKSLKSEKNAELEQKTMDVESLTTERDALYETIAEQKVEIERLKDDKNRLEKMMDNLGKELDAEKIKNF